MFVVSVPGEGKIIDTSSRDMPVALERALKRKASKLGLSKERKDAYVYGTLRKTGWKPSREKKMSSLDSQTIRLSRIDKELDSLIQFRQPMDEPPPRIQSWNPITRHREQQHLREWVKSRPPSAGISAEQLEKRYPENPKEKRAIKTGLAIGGGVGVLGGGATGALLSKGEPKGVRAAVAGGSALIAGTYGALGGGIIAGLPYTSKRMREHKEAVERLIPEFTGAKTVPVESLKSPVPTATKYREVTSELKAQGVGFVPRHATALATRPLAWTGKNAAFVPRGEKGLIVTPRKVHPTVFRHEAGHAKDYAYYGGQQGFREAYPHYGDPFVGRKERVSSTMLPEHRAWAYAKPRTKKEKQLKEDALTTYRTALGLSALLDSIIEFQEDDDQKKFPWLKTGAAVGAGAGGVLAHQAIQKTGGYGANLLAMRRGGQDLLGQATGNVAQGAGKIGGALAPAYSAGKDVLGAGAAAGKSAWQSILAKLARPAAQALKSKEKPIEFDASILGPWHGKTGHTSKIDQLEFPAGLSPAAALRFPFPVLMRYLNQRKLLQQQFSWKMDRLIQLGSKLNEIMFEKEEYKPRIGQRVFLGNPLTTAIHGKEGFRYGGYRQAKARKRWEELKGVTVGGAGGAGLGAGIGALAALKRPGTIAESAARGAFLGGGLGTFGGGIVGSVKGEFGKKGTDVYKRYTGQG